jgi:hypothetical protein
VKAGDLVKWKNDLFAKESNYLVICPDPTHSECYKSECWQALSCRGNLVIVHADAMEVISEAG